MDGKDIVLSSRDFVQHLKVSWVFISLGTDVDVTLRKSSFPTLLAPLRPTHTDPPHSDHKSPNLEYPIYVSLGSSRLLTPWRFVDGT